MDMSKDRDFYIVVVMFLVTAAMLMFTHYKLNESENMIDDIEYVDSTNTYNKLYVEKTFKALKKENSELYDSLKAYKDKITYLVQFTHEKHYVIDTVYVKDKISIENDTMLVDTPLVSKTYEYQGEPNDTLQYRLLINSHTEPNWYSLEASVKNKFTIVNKDYGDGMNHITIDPSNGNISDVTVFKKKSKDNLWKRISIGPSVTAGYDVINKNPGVMVGVSVTFNLKK